MVIDETFNQEEVNPDVDEAEAVNVTAPEREAVERLLGRYRNEKSGRISRFLQMVFSLLLWALVPVTMVMSVLSFWAGDYKSRVISLVLVSTTVGIWVAVRTQRRKNFDHITLAQYDDVRAITPLIYALGWSNRRTQIVVASALTRLLPKLKASDASLLPFTQQKRLCALLTDRVARTNPDLAVAILNALEQVGDVRLAPVVQKQAEANASTQAQRRVRLAAENCLMYLLDRGEQERSSNMLLRPARGSSVHDSNLLRPATGKQEADPGLLLRSSERPKE